MPELNFSLKVVSPAFVAGAMEEEVKIADKTIAYRRIGPKFGDGLRVPSLRGVLRFWYRAMNGLNDVKKLNQQEAEIFGDTTHGQGLRIIPCGPDKWSVRAETGSQVEGYLGYGPLALKDGDFKSHNNNAQRDAIIPGSLFQFRALGTKEQIEVLQKCLIMLHLFGGIGSRSRRAWGSIIVSAEFIPSVDDNNFEDWFIARLNFVFPKGLLSSTVQYSALTLCSDIRYFSVPQSKKESYQEVFKEFFEQFKNLRHYKTGKLGMIDVKEEHRDFESGSLNTLPKRVAFGLPYQPGKSKEWALRYLGNKSPKIDRRASPLILKVLPSNNYTYGIALFLKTSTFFGKSDTEMVAEKCEGETKKDKWKPLSGKLDCKDWSAIDQFLAKKEWQKINLHKIKTGGTMG